MHLDRSTQQKLFTYGHFAKGTVYAIMGGFAIATVIGAASGPGGPKAVIDWIGQNPLGQILLFLIAVGLASYCGWRWYKAVADTENEGHDKEGSTKRVAWAISGTAYGILSVYAITLLTNGSGNGSNREDMIAQILQESWGQIVIGLIGVILMCVGIYQAYRGFSEKFMEDIDSAGWSSDRRHFYVSAGKIGHLSRLVIYGIIGYFLVRAAMSSDASQYKGIGDALSYIQDGSWGVALLALTGVGLLAYGFFMFIKARYKRI